jgi:predicted SnoaL-like aldol condensation-catalyzing enzyme
MTFDIPRTRALAALHGIAIAATSLSLLLGVSLAFASGTEMLVSKAGIESAGAFHRSTQNQSVVRDFYEAALNRKDFRAASRFIGNTYIQHNPRAEDGPAGLAKFIAHLRTEYPASHWEIKRFVTDGDLVAVHVLEKLQPEDRGSAVIDIFRLEGGKIV